MAAQKTNPVTAVLLLVVIVGAIALGVVLTKKPKDRERQQYDYTVFAIASDGTVYKWNGHTSEWPVAYDGKELLPLYVCEKSHTFAGQAKGITSQCPTCGTKFVGAYDEETKGPINAIEIDDPSN